ncbi:MAG: hypothetical protein AAF933_01220 [Pseudomonadota bacterium]
MAHGSIDQNVDMENAGKTYSLDVEQELLVDDAAHDVFKSNAL